MKTSAIDHWGYKVAQILAYGIRLDIVELDILTR